MEAKYQYLLKDKKCWIASFLIVWAAGLQGHMMWLQRQDAFKQKFGDQEDDSSRTQETPKQEFGELEGDSFRSE